MTKYLLAIGCFLFALSVVGQDVNLILRDAQKEEAAFREREALAKYLEVLRYQPQHLTALCKTSELYSILGKRQQSKDKQKQYYQLGKKYAEQALRVNPNHAESNFVMAIAMGRIALISSGEERIQAVREIRNYAEKCVRIDPNNYKGYHVLARWYLEISNLNSVERMLVKVAYGALPKATLEDAIKYYEKSRSLNPTFVVNYLELAKAYNRKGEEKKAIEMLRTMEKLPNTAADDPKIKREGRELLKEIE